jgi:hypothetical protein
MVQGAQTKKVIIRAIGPELSRFGIPNVLVDPTLELFDGTGALIASNDNWQHTIIGGIITSDQVVDIRNSGHAHGHPRESAIIAGSASRQLYCDRAGCKQDYRSRSGGSLRH